MKRQDSPMKINLPRLILLIMIILFGFGGWIRHPYYQLGHDPLNKEPSRYIRQQNARLIKFGRDQTEVADNKKELKRITSLMKRLQSHYEKCKRTFPTYTNLSLAVEDFDGNPDTLELAVAGYDYFPLTFLRGNLRSSGFYIFRLVDGKPIPALKLENVGHSVRLEIANLDGSRRAIAHWRDGGNRGTGFSTIIAHYAPKSREFTTVSTKKLSRYPVKIIDVDNNRVSEIVAYRYFPGGSYPHYHQVFFPELWSLRGGKFIKPPVKLRKAFYEQFILKMRQEIGDSKPSEEKGGESRYVRYRKQAIELARKHIIDSK